jgi:cytoskeletal protein RodZ
MPKVKKAKRPLFSRLTKRPLLTLGIVLALLLGGGLAYAQLKSNQPSNQPASNASDRQSGDYINLTPPTEQDKNDAAQNKKNLANDTPSPPSTVPDGKKEVTPVITNASTSEVRAYVPGIFEDGGTCKATATKGSQTVTKSSAGFADVNKTSCVPIKWSLAGSGWSVILSYSSSTAQGKSEAYSVD